MARLKVCQNSYADAWSFAVKKTSKDVHAYRTTWQFLEESREQPGLTLKEFAATRKLNISTASERLGRVNEDLGNNLFSRQPGKLEIKDEAWRVQPRLRRLIQADELLQQCPLEEESCHDPTFRIVATSGIFDCLCQGPRMQNWLDMNSEYGFDRHPWTCAEMRVGLRSGTVQLAIAPEFQAQGLTLSDRKVDVERFDEPVDVVAIFHPQHRLATDKRIDGRQNVMRSELSSLRLLMPSCGVAPGLSEKLLPPQPGGVRRPVENLREIYDLVRAEKKWVGLVPGFYWLLEGDRHKGRLEYLPVSGIDQFQIAVYYPRKLRGRLRPFCDFFFNAHLAGFTFRAPKLVGPKACMPKELELFQFEHYLSCHQLDGEPVQWYRDRVHFDPREYPMDRVSGTITPEETGGPPYKFTGQVSQCFLNYTAWNCHTQDEYCVSLQWFQIDGEDYLIGDWKGKDALGQPVDKAPIVLSGKRLDRWELTGIGRRLAGKSLSWPRFWLR